MADGWITPANIIATCGLIASATACAISWRVFRWQRSSDSPVVSLEDYSRSRGTPYYMLQIGLSNPAAYALRVTSCAIVRPRRVVGISDARTKDRGVMSAGSVPETLSGEALSSKFEFPLTATAGQSKFAWLFVESPDPTKPLNLSIRLSLASNEAVQRNRTIAIKRTLPALISTA